MDQIPCNEPMTDNTQQNIRLNTLIEIQINGTLIAVVDRHQQKVNIFFWKGWIVEIHCQRLNGQWTPFSIKYHVLTPEYEENLIQQLNSNQRIRLTTVTKAFSVN